MGFPKMKVPFDYQGLPKVPLGFLEFPKVP